MKSVIKYLLRFVAAELLAVGHVEINNVKLGGRQFDVKISVVEDKCDGAD